MVFNTFIGVLIEKFSDIKNEESPYKHYNAEQKEWAIIRDGIY